MKLDWNRVIRTLIQTACGAGVSLITALSANWSRDAVITSVIEFATTVIIALLMNIESQTKEDN